MQPASKAGPVHPPRPARARCRRATSLRHTARTGPSRTSPSGGGTPRSCCRSACARRRTAARNGPTHHRAPGCDCRHRTGRDRSGRVRWRGVARGPQAPAGRATGDGKGFSRVVSGHWYLAGTTERPTRSAPTSKRWPADTVKTRSRIPHRATRSIPTQWPSWRAATPTMRTPTEALMLMMLSPWDYWQGGLTVPSQRSGAERHCNRPVAPSCRLFVAMLVSGR